MKAAEALYLTADAMKSFTYKLREDKSFTTKIFSNLNNIFLSWNLGTSWVTVWGIFQSIFSEKVSHFFIPFAVELHFL